MSPNTKPDGPFPYPTTSSWSENLYEAIVNTCEAESLAPPPERAVIEGLAPALGAGEAKRVTELRAGSRMLRATAYHVEGRGTPGALLLLDVELHGAAALPWMLNDRTRSDWMPATPEARARLEELVSRQIAVSQAEADFSRAKAAANRVSRVSAVQEKNGAVSAVKEAEQALKEAQAAHTQAQEVLGGRYPLPEVRTATEDGAPRAALTTSRMSVAIAAEIQRYTVERLRQRGSRRPYDLLEALVQEGQRESTVAVLQLTVMEDSDGASVEAWRLFQVTGNNRADERTQAFGVEAAQMLTGVPQPSLLLPDEQENRKLLLRGQAEILRRISVRGNAELSEPGHDPEGVAARTERLAQVRTRVVVGARTPERLEASLRDINVHDHLRGQLVYTDEDRALGLWSTVVKTYEGAGALGDLLAEVVTHDRIKGHDLDATGIADALTGSGSLEPLAPLLLDETKPTRRALRDIAIRCTTALLFPPVPARPDDLPARAPMPTGRYWPLVRTALQEAAWSVDAAKKAERRTEVWAVAIGQHFPHRGNLQAMAGAFGANDTKVGVHVDPRTLDDLLKDSYIGDKKAWGTLVRRHLLPHLVNAPDPFITPGQGSESKGIRRPPANAVNALVKAYTETLPGVTRALLLAFAEALLDAPDTTESVNGCPPGTFLAPDAAGVPRPGVRANKAWYDELFPKSSGSRSRGKPGGSAGKGETDNAQDDQPADTEANKELSEDLPEPPLVRLTRLRGDLPGKIEDVRQNVEDTAKALEALAEHIKEAVDARMQASAPEEPTEIQKSYAKDVSAIQEAASELAVILNGAPMAAMDL